MATKVTADSTVVVAALSDWHPLQATCRRRLAEVDWLPAHAITETVAVLTRLPKGLAVPVEAAVESIRGVCPKARHLDADQYLPILASVGRAGLSGGAIHDAVIGATAREHRVTLLTLDRRAQRTYQAVGASFEVLG